MIRAHDPDFSSFVGLHRERSPGAYTPGCVLVNSPEPASINPVLKSSVRSGTRLSWCRYCPVSGTSMGRVLGGFNRELSRNNYVYERVIVDSLDQAIRNQMRRVHNSLVDNQTKLRLVDLREPCGLYFHSNSPMNRTVFRWTFKYNDVQVLWQLENPQRGKQSR